MVEFPDETRRDELMHANVAAMAALPRQRYPFLIEAGPDLVDCEDTEEYYSSGIEMILAGVMAASAVVG